MKLPQLQLSKKNRATRRKEEKKQKVTPFSPRELRRLMAFSAFYSSEELLRMPRGSFCTVEEVQERLCKSLEW